MKVEESPIIIEQAFEKPASYVWQAITELKHMQNWFFNNIWNFKAEVGFKTSFIISNDGRDFNHLWEIIRVVPNKTIKYNWKYEGYPGNSNVEFNLNEYASKTNLKLIVTILEDFPDSIPEFKLESCKAGWDYFIKFSLKNYIDNMI